MEKSVKAAAVQFNIALGDIETNVASVTAALRRLAREGVELAVLPEMWSCGFAYRELNNLAKRTITLNMLGQNPMGLPANTLIGGQLERATYSGNFLGFVFGEKNANDWKFYFNGLGAGISTLRRIF